VNSLPLSVLMMTRSIHRFTLEFADTLTMRALLAQRDASAAALARLIGAGDAQPFELAYAAAHVDALDAVIAERSWATFTRQNGGRYVA